MSGSPTRLPNGLYGAAKSAGAAKRRSTAQQIAHWARIGREIVASPGVSQRDIERVLAGDDPYDSLSERERAVIRAVWNERMDERRAALNFEDEFTAAGQSWSEADEDGKLVVRNAQHTDAEP